jgi:hypothetical protein
MLFRRASGPQSVEQRTVGAMTFKNPGKENKETKGRKKEKETKEKMRSVTEVDEKGYSEISVLCHFNAHIQ